jgi:hypothetical protein
MRNTLLSASGYDVVSFHEKSQSPVGQRQLEAVPGKSSITARYNGAMWAFSTTRHRDLFVADPEKYAPAFDGHCAYGVAKGGKVPGNPNLWRVLDGTLYLNITPQVVGFWEADIPGFLVTAATNWKQLASDPASTRSWKQIDANDGTYTRNAPIQ